MVRRKFNAHSRASERASEPWISLPTSSSPSICICALFEDGRRTSVVWWNISFRSLGGGERYIAALALGDPCQRERVHDQTDGVDALNFDVL